MTCCAGQSLVASVQPGGIDALSRRCQADAAASAAEAGNPFVRVDAATAIVSG